MKQNILKSFLKSLGVRHTNQFSNEIYMNHPYKYSLYGISKMLEEYHVTNVGVRVSDKDIDRLSIPFVAQLDQDFVVVNHIKRKDGKVCLIRNGIFSSVTMNEFKEQWSGAALIAEPDLMSVEPEYWKHRLSELISKGRNLLIGLIVCVILCSTIYKNWSFYSFKEAILFFLNLAGGVCSYLLLLKQLHISNEYANKFCSLFHQKDCSSVTDSKAAKIMDIFSWSEIGFGYFVSNMIILLFLPKMITYLALINMCTLPYTLWSIWYQYKKIKQWCVLCVIVQVILWCIFAVNILVNNFVPNGIFFDHIFIISAIYLFPFLIINLLARLLSDRNKYRTKAWLLNEFKMKDGVFETLLKKQPYYSVNRLDSNLIWGNPNAQIGITVLTNPHCEPCAEVHKQLNELLEKEGNRIYIQYIFSAFSNELLLSNRFLIAAYFQSDRKQATTIYSDWFEKEKYRPLAFFERYDFLLNTEDIQLEIENHFRWRMHNRLVATPVILINGYKLPPEYSIQDLGYKINEMQSID